MRDKVSYIVFGLMNVILLLGIIIYNSKSDRGIKKVTHATSTTNQVAERTHESAHSTTGNQEIAYNNSDNNRRTLMEWNVPEETIQKVTFQGVPIEGSESTIINSLKSKGFKMKKTEWFSEDLECTFIKINAPNLYKKLSIYQYWPHDNNKNQDPKYRNIYVVFLNDELWRLYVVLEYDNIPDLKSIVNEFGNKYSTTMQAAGSSLYIANIGNTKVRILGISYSYSDYSHDYTYRYSERTISFDYRNMDVDAKVGTLLNNEEDQNTKRSIDML